MFSFLKSHDGYFLPFTKLSLLHLLRDFIFLTTISNNKYFNKFFNKCFNKYYSIIIKLTLISQNIKVVAAEMKYFEKRKSSGSLIYKENLDLIWQIVHKLEYLFCEGR